MAFDKNKETEFGIIRNNFKDRESRDGFREHRESFERRDGFKSRDNFKPREGFNSDRPRFNKDRDGFTRRKTDGDRRVSFGDPDGAPQTAIGGIREVTDLLERSPMQVHRVLFMHQSGNPKLYELQKLAKRAHVHVQQVDSKVLNTYTTQHHGVVALLNEKELLVWEDIREEYFAAKQKGERKLIAVGTNIEDPRNLGACIRSALALGVDLLMLPAKGMCGITPAVARSAAGALDKMKICRPNNLEAALYPQTVRRCTPHSDDARSAFLQRLGGTLARSVRIRTPPNQVNDSAIRREQNDLTQKNGPHGPFFHIYRLN